MKILYAIQGTGNGHICRGIDIIEALRQRVQVDILISGTQADIELPFEVHYKFEGISFIFGKKGGVDMYESWKRNNAKRIMKEIRSIPIKDYDLVINDFEPISAWAARFNRVPIVSLSHQAALLSLNTPKPNHRDWLGKFILKYYAPAKQKYGFHFLKYDDNMFLPIIRKEVRELQVDNLGHYTVYLPAYSDKRIVNVLSSFPDTKWEVFSKNCTSRYQIKNITVTPIENERFVQSMATSEGILCGAGFETPAEALYLNKKLLVIPMKKQYEQHFNCAALKAMGVPSIKSLKKKHIKKISKWLESRKKVLTFYPNNTQRIVDIVLENHLDVVQWQGHSGFELSPIH